MQCCQWDIYTIKLSRWLPTLHIDSDSKIINILGNGLKEWELSFHSYSLFFSFFFSFFPSLFVSPPLALPLLHSHMMNRMYRAIVFQKRIEMQHLRCKLPSNNNFCSYLHWEFSNTLKKNIEKYCILFSLLT